jgi:hypothetical protein
MEKIPIATDEEHRDSLLNIILNSLDNTAAFVIAAFVIADRLSARRSAHRHVNTKMPAEIKLLEGP